jgi:hypothetical protein
MLEGKAKIDHDNPVVIQGSAGIYDEKTTVSRPKVANP